MHARLSFAAAAALAVAANAQFPTNDRYTIFNGCFEEPDGLRILDSTFYYDNQQMTTSKCLRYCATRGTTYASLTFKNDLFSCYCSNSIDADDPLRLSDNSCNVACPGDGEENCGGVDTMEQIFQAYAVDVPVVPVVEPLSAWPDQGCYPDNFGGPSIGLAGGATLNVGTIEECLGWCGQNGYQYAGLKTLPNDTPDAINDFGGTTCQCSNTFTPFGDELDGLLSCNEACPDNGLQTCGGFTGSLLDLTSAQAFMRVYRRTIEPEPPLPTTTAGDDATTTAGDDATTTAGDDATTTAGDDATTTAGDDATTTAGDDATTTAGDDATTTVGDDATTTAGDDATTTAGDDATTTAGDDATTTAGDDATTTAGDDATTTAGDDATTTAGDDATTTAGDDATTTAGDDATTTAGDDATTTAGDDATTTAGDDATTTAGDDATTTAGDDATTTAGDDATTTAGDDATTTAGDDATTTAGDDATTTGADISSTTSATDGSDSGTSTTQGDDSTQTSPTGTDGTQTTPTATDGGQTDTTGGPVSPTSSNTDIATSTTSGETPAATNIEEDPRAIIIQVFFGPVTFNIGRRSRVEQRKVAKRQAPAPGTTAGFAGSDTGCASADRFLVLANQLVTDEGVVSTSGDVAFSPLVASVPVAAITTEFDIDANGFLRWTNPAFVGGEAIFCQTPDGVINALFEGPFNAAYPASCVVVSLRTVPASLCRNNQIVDPVTGLPVDGSAPGAGAGNGAPTAGLPANYFTVPQVNRICVPSVLSYYQGQPTVLPIAPMAARA